MVEETSSQYSEIHIGWIKPICLMLEMPRDLTVKRKIPSRVELENSQKYSMSGIHEKGGNMPAPLASLPFERWKEAHLKQRGFKGKNVTAPRIKKGEWFEQKRSHWRFTDDALLWTMVAKRKADYSMNEHLKKPLKSASLRKEKGKSGLLACTCCQVIWIKCFLGHSWSLGERDIEESKENTVEAVCTLIPVIPSTSEAAKIHREVKRGKGP